MSKEDCSPKDCKKCGKWWTVSGEDTTTKQRWSEDMCAYKAMHAEQCKTNVLLKILINSSNERGNLAIEGLLDVFQRQEKIMSGNSGDGNKKLDL